MKTKLSILITIALVAVSLTASAQIRNKFANAKYSPVSEFLDTNSTLSQWYKQYVDTKSGTVNFEDFLKRLSASEVLLQRSNRIGMSRNQLYSPIVTLQGKDFLKLDGMEDTDLATIRLAMVELDIFLATVEASVPQSAIEEFRREIFRGAKALTQVGEKPKEVPKTPTTAVEAMQGLTVPELIVTDRLNKSNSELKKSAPKDSQDLTTPGSVKKGYFRDF